MNYLEKYLLDMC